MRCIGTTQNFFFNKNCTFISFKQCVTTHSVGFNEKSFGRIWKDLKNLRNAEVQKQLYWVLHWYVRCFYFLSYFPLQKVNLKPHALCIDRNCSLLDKVPPIVLCSKYVLSWIWYGKKLCFTLLRTQASSMITRFSCYDYSHETQELCWYDNQNNSSLPL